MALTLIRRMHSVGLPVALATLISVAGSLAAQDDATATASTTEDVPETTAAVGQPRAPWLVSCSNQAESAVLQCETSQSIIAGPQSQRLATVSVLRAVGDNAATGLFTLPIGLNLPAGLTISVDDTDLLNLPFQSCDAQGCYALSPLEAGHITALSDGAELVLTVQSQAKENIRISFELRGFKQSLALVPE